MVLYNLTELHLYHVCLLTSCVPGDFLTSLLETRFSLPLYKSGNVTEGNRQTFEEEGQAVIKYIHIMQSTS